MLCIRYVRAVVLGWLLLPGHARAEFYQWVDARGQVHMTDDLSRVPPAQRAAAQQTTVPEEIRPHGGGWNAIRSRPPHETPPAAASRATQRGGRIHEIPVERAGTSLRVVAVLDGRQRAIFKVDTGAELNMVPASVVAAMGIGIDDSTPTTTVVGISGQPMNLPVVRFEEVRLGTARVGDVKMVVNPRSRYGLLGLTFFNHFKVRTDPAAGRLTLEDVDLEGVEGIYGGFGESYWRRQFTDLHGQIEAVVRERADAPSTHVTLQERLEARERALRRQLDDLHERASRAGVPQAWRE